MRWFQFVLLSHMRITIVLVKLVSSSCRRFQNGEREAVKKCFKGKLLFHARPRNKTSGCNESSESENANIAGENNVDCISDAKGLAHHEFVPEEQSVNCTL
jgi:hypothetical protein